MIVNTIEAVRDTIRAMRAGLVVMLQGDPGIGKSAILQGIAKAHNLLLIDIRLAQCDPTDLNGFPTTMDLLDKKGKFWKKIATYIPMDTFPLEGDPLPVNPATGKQYDGWLIFFDEFNSAPLAVQAASYKIILDQKVGQHNIHPRAKMVCAGNLSTNNAIVNRLSTAMQSRLIHLQLEADIETWTDWASKSKLDHRVISYVSQVPKNLHNFDSNHSDKTFACPRTWDFSSQLIIHEKGRLDDYLQLLAGTVSEGVAREFITYTNMYTDLPTFPEIKNSPKTAKLNDDPGLHYAVSHLIAAHTNVHNIAPVIDYVNRMPIEFQTITLQNVIHRDKAILKEECVRDWVAINAAELF